MRSLREWITRLLGTVRGQRSDRDLELELRLHARTGGRGGAPAS